VHRHPLYYGVRNHIIDFLVSRSKNFAEEMLGANYDRRHVPVVRPAAPSATSSVSSISPLAEKDAVRGLRSPRDNIAPAAGEQTGSAAGPTVRREAGDSSKRMGTDTIRSKRERSHDT
jgi:hypothetical protein